VRNAPTSGREDGVVQRTQTTERSPVTTARSTAEYEREECTNLRAGGRCRAAHSDNGEESSDCSAEHSGIRE